jgi:hypothetical protein
MIASLLSARLVLAAAPSRRRIVFAAAAAAVQRAHSLRVESASSTIGAPRKNFAS